MIKVRRGEVLHCPECQAVVAIGCNTCRAITAALKRLLERDGYPPYQREIAEEAGVDARTLNSHLNAHLIPGGLVVYRPGKVRGLTLPGYEPVNEGVGYG